MPRPAAVPSRRRLGTIVLTAMASAIVFLSVVTSASALSLGVGWTDYPQAENDMAIVGKSGAQVFRVPFEPVNAAGGNWSFYDTIVERAALNGVTILPYIQGRINGQSGLPSNPEKSAWSAWVGEAVKRYGYNGSFWAAHPSVPARPIKTWELWNEPKQAGISAEDYGDFLAWAAPAIQAASSVKTEVLFGGILSWGNKRSQKEEEAEVEKSALERGLKYLDVAYNRPGARQDITGIAIHPYAVDPTTFKAGYTALEAMKYQVGSFWAVLNELPGGTGKSLWITEIGWPAAGEHSVGASNQASLLTETFEYAKKNASTLRLGGVVWYNYRDATAYTNWARNCGLRGEAGEYRASWYAFQEQAGAPRWPLPGPNVRAVFVDGGNANTISGWQYGSESGWQQFFLWGHEVAPGTKPLLLRYEETPHIFYVDASRGNQISEWSWNSVTGWQQKFLETDPVAANSSPSGILVGGLPRIYFSDAATNRSIAAISYNGSSWSQTRLYGDPAAEGTSPSAIATGGGSQAFFVDAAKGNTIAAWTWSGAIYQSFLYGDPVAANSSPSAISVSGTSQVFFVDAAKGNTIAVWSWGSGLVQQFLYGDPVAANSSPSAILNGSNRQIFFANAAQGNTISAWTWGSTLAQSNFYGDSVTANSSPSAVLVNGQSHVYFSDLNTNNSLAVWQWGSTLTQTRLFGHPAAAGSSPGA